jgi:uncharacterized repeat protein (TIGR03803 family)
MFQTSLKRTSTKLASILILALAMIATQPARAQTFSVLHYFTGGSDGGNPTAGVTVAAAGTLYGTAAGGQSQYGAVFKLTQRGSGWTLDPLYDFTGSGGAYPYSGVVIGPSGAPYGTTIGGGYGVGTVYELRPPATACKTAICYWSETVPHAFTGNVGDGGFPEYGNVTFDQAGNMYGTTSAFGAFACGVVWELTPSAGGWTESVLYNFTGGTDGCSPASGVIFDTAGNLYGTTACIFACEGQGLGTIYQLVPSNGGWVENTLLEFNASTGTHPIGTLTADQSGNFYGTASEDGPNGSGTVYELSPSNGGWTFSLVYAFSSCNPLAGVTLGPDGNLYGVCQDGGANAEGWVFKMPPTCNQTCTPTDLHDFNGTEGADPQGPVAFDASGNLYGTTFEGGIGDCSASLGTCGVVWEITP